MAILKKEVFLASRFEEFKEIRKLLAQKMNKYTFIEIVDLNDNKATHNSPLTESLYRVKKSEIMILLVGETYGSIPEGEDLSYTHLEYKESIKDDSNARVLVFAIGKAYAGKNIDYSNDEKMKKWQKELEGNHRISKFANTIDVNEIADEIMINVLSSLYELNPEENLSLGEDEEFFIQGIDEENDFYENEEVLFLDNKHSDDESISMIKLDDNTYEAHEILKNPQRFAALEQRREAQKALTIHEYSTAIYHLKKALECRPLDFESNYWLAKLYIISAKKSLFPKIEDLLVKAAKVAYQENQIFKASHCYQLIVLSSIFSEKKHEGLKYIKLSENLTPSFARLFFVKAKYMLYFNEDYEAQKALLEAINIRIDIVKDISRDPYFMQYKEVVKKVKAIQKKSLEKSCYAISSQTNTIREIFGIEVEPIDIKDLSIYGLWKYSRIQFSIQYDLLQVNLNKLDK